MMPFWAVKYMKVAVVISIDRKDGTQAPSF